MLTVLMQDESKILSILNDDGTINEWKLDQLRRDLNLPPRGGFRPSGDEFRGGFLPNPGQYIDNNNHYGYGEDDRYSGQFSPDLEPSSFHPMHRIESMSRPRMSRWSAPADSAHGNLLGSDSDMFQDRQPWQREGRGGGGGQFRDSLKTSNNMNDKYGPGDGFLNDDRNRFGPGDDAGRKRIRPQKTNTPCKFFNTPKGCQFGSKCAFGHYAESSNGGGGSGGGGSGTSLSDRAPVQGSLGGVPKRSRFSPPATTADSFGR